MSDDDLRTALTKLADEHDAQPGPYAHILHTVEIRDLLEAHPAPTPDEDKWSHFATEREDVAEMLAREAADAETMPVAEGRYVRNPAPVPDTRREDDELVEAVARALSRSEHPGVQAYIDARAVLAVLPAPPVVDEAEVEREALRQFPDDYYVPDRDSVRLGFEAGAEWAIARLRGATRG